jgi:flavin-dependent dehydrogenase
MLLPLPLLLSAAAAQVLVVGAGAAGLTAAYFAAKGGAQVRDQPEGWCCCTMSFTVKSIGAAVLCCV